jgi:hypothetical protein
VRRPRGGSPGTGPAWTGPAWTGPAGHVAPRCSRARPAPAVRIVILDGRPRPVVPARGAARRARPWRPVHAIRPRRHPAPVRQPVLAGRQPAIGPARPRGVRPSGVRPSAGRSTARGRAMLGSTVLGRTMRHAAARPAGIGPACVWCARVRPGVRRSAMRHRAVRAAIVLIPARGTARTPRPAVRRSAAARRAAGRRAAARRAATRYAPRRAAGDPASRDPAVAGASVRRRARRETTRLARLRPARLAHPRLPGRHLARSSQQLPVVAVLGLGPTAWPGRIILLGRVPLVLWIGPRAIAAAVTLAPGGTVCVTAKAGVATFHPIPPGPWSPAARRDTRPYLLSVGRRKSPV